MFEFTEDRKSLRPKYIGTIKNKWLRRISMFLVMPFTVIAVILVNYSVFLFWVAVAAWRMIVMGTIKPLLSPFKKPEYWDEPRIPKP